jgi:hypothetical protein
MLRMKATRSRTSPSRDQPAATPLKPRQEDRHAASRQDADLPLPTSRGRLRSGSRTRDVEYKKAMAGEMTQRVLRGALRCR